MASQITPPIHKNRNVTMQRISGYYSGGSLFRNINLSGKIYEDVLETKELDYFSILGPHGKWQEFSKEDILNAAYVKHNPSNQYGPTWTTHWFRVLFDTPPASWVGKEIHFIWASGCEATVYDTDLNVLQGISPGFREEMIITKSYDPANPPSTAFYVEMACNGMFGEGAGDMIAPTNNDRFFSLSRVDLRVFNREVFNLIVDFEQLYGMADQLNNTHIGYQAMFVANEMVTLSKKGNYTKARELATTYFSDGVGSKSHTLHAMGHCHIDCPWLWPNDETIRKCARSFSAQLGLIDEYPNEFKFVCSSAQQYQYVKEWYPELFERIKAKVRSGQFVPVGGTWIEMDGNIPNGEAFIRQYYYGQKFFENEFGIEYRSKEFWLPDTFGYSAQIPQMLKHVNIERFLTQKMSWSLVNKFPNHNFWWEGIDGSQVLVHFPPGDSYNMNGNVDECLRSQNNSLDKGRCNTGVYLYGYGDGGGGPTRKMIEKIKRVQNVDGMPRIIFSDSNTFFDKLSEEKGKFYRWVGELYLELHNGTYTSQARIKWYNRKGEFFFREVELLMALAYSTLKVTKPVLDGDMAIIDQCWKDFLLNQFHDTLPGSCIEAVAEDAWIIYRRIFQNLETLRTRYNEYILGSGALRAIFNSLPWECKTVVFMKPDVGAPPSGANIQSNVILDTDPFIDEGGEGEGKFRVPSTFSAALVSLRASGYSTFSALPPTIPVTFTASTINPNFGTYSNGTVSLEVEINPDGTPVEQLFFGGSERIPVFKDKHNVGISPAMFYFYDDVPLYWDAWDVMDYHLETRETLPNLQTNTPVQGFAPGPIVGGYKWGGTFGDRGSSFTRYTILRAESPMVEYYTIIDWKEDHKLIKVEWPVDVLTREATYEIQYGHAQRPTHINTSWEMAKFEVCGHKWMDISQADKGVTFITDSKYGWHVRDNHVELSLLKSPKNPDFNCDMQKHYIYYAVLPHKGSFQGAEVIQRAYELNTLSANNVPLVSNALPEAQIPANFVTTSNPAVVIEAVKVSNALDTTVNTICIRLYEAYGGNANTDISCSGFTILKAFESNGLEDVNGEEQVVVGNKFLARFRPFQIRTFLVTF